MLPSSSQQLIEYPKVKVTPEKVKEILESLWMDNSDNSEAFRNSTDEGRAIITSVLKL